MAEVTPDQIHQLLRALDDLYVSNLLAGAAATLALYDWVLVFNIEYQTIWQSRWTIPKALFYYIRFITPPGILLGAFHLWPLRGDLSVTFCRAWATIAIFGMLSSLIASNALFMMRLIALYKRNRIMVYFIYIFFFASYGATLGLVLSALFTYFNNIYYYEALHLCSTTAVSKTMPAIFYAPAAFEAFVFFLTAYRAWRDAKVFTGPNSAPFLVVLYRDGIISFIVMVGIRIWNVWIYTTAPLSSYNMGTLIMWAINTVLTTRVYMNLVWLAKKPLLEASTKELTIGATAGIRMRVHTITEVHTDGWSRNDHDGRFDTMLKSIQEVDSPESHSPFESKAAYIPESQYAARAYTSFTPDLSKV